MKVSDLMTREVKSCLADEDLNRASQIMWEEDCGVVPVVDSEKHVVGVITDRDACMASYTKGLPLGSIRVGEAMSKEVFSCSSQDAIEKALAVMEKSRVRRLPVVDEERKLVGILSLNDLAREAERQGRSGGGQLSAAQVEGTLAAVCQPRPRPEPMVSVPAAAPRDSRVDPMVARQADAEC